jgi:hypothetical protein
MSKTYGGQGSSSHVKFKASKGSPKPSKVVKSSKPNYVPGPKPKAC